MKTTGLLKELDGALGEMCVSHEVRQELQFALRGILRRDWDARVLRAWADEQEADAVVTLTSGRGDSHYWLLSFHRQSNATDPETMPPDELSFYDEAGDRVWELDGESAEEATARAAKKAYELLSKHSQNSIGERP